VKTNRLKQGNVDLLKLTEKLAHEWSESKQNEIEFFITIQNQEFNYTFIGFKRTMSQRGTTLHERFSGLTPHNANAFFCYIKKSDIIHAFIELVNNNNSTWEINDPKGL
jgi:hypothetical protein